MKKLLSSILTLLTASSLSFSQSGHVGIGTTSPQTTLHIHSDTVPHLRLSGTGINPPNAGIIQFTESPIQEMGNFEVAYDGQLNKFKIRTWDGIDILDRFVIDRATGNIGVGTITPASRLEVAGTIHSSTGGYKFPDNTTQTSASFGDGHSLDAADGNPVDALFIDNNGYVGIGTTSPQQLLEVNAASISSSTSFTGNRIVFERAAGDSYIDKEDANNIRFRFGISNTERMIIKNDGSVGIGLNNPGNRLDIRDDGTGGTRTILLGLIANTSDRPSIQFSEGTEAGPTNGMSIEYNGSGGGSENKLHINGSDDIPKLTVETGGFVGINNDDPQVLLHIGDVGVSAVNNADYRTILSNTTNSRRTAFVGLSKDISGNWVESQFESNGSNGFIKIGSATNHPVWFTVNNSNRLYLSDNNRIGIFNTNPAYPLDLRGPGIANGGLTSPEVVARFKQDGTSNHSAVSIDALQFQDAILYFSENGNAFWDIRNDQSTFHELNIRYHGGTGDNTTVIKINEFTANFRCNLVPWNEAEFSRLGLSNNPWDEIYANSYTTVTAPFPSSKSIKSFERIEDGLAKIASMNPAYINSEDNSGPKPGFFAAELHEALPASVTIDEEGNYCVDYNSLIPVLIGAIQEQQEMIESQQDQINQLTKLLKAEK